MLDIGIVIGNDLDGRATVANTHFDVTIIVSDIKKLFKIIGGDISFLIELI